MNRFRQARVTNQNAYAAWKVELQFVLLLLDKLKHVGVKPVLDMRRSVHKTRIR